ncbi:MAG: aldehyde ferredoxin oxidoreductase family protein [Syntrophomonadaceae bacterium]|nr:aldehyde ferredoxin oxidoreductase family protein [Syntrophomonadaceae bacterium]
MYGYAGRLLEVDLSRNRISIRELAPEFARKHIGGIGFNAAVLYEELPAGIDPLSEDNMLVFGVGTMVGTPFPTAARTEVSAKSPMTGQFGTSNSGAFFGTQLKGSGFDALIIKGKAERPVYIYVDNGKAEILDASFLWGKDAWEAIDLLKSKHYGVEVALIGQAGENLVRFASIENGYYDGWGRTGLGAVMGSKRLKAVAVRGTQATKPYDVKGLLEISKECQELIKSSPFYIPFTKYGTMNAAVPYGRFGAMGTYNFSRGPLPDWEERAGRQVVEKYSSRHVACQSCIIACGHWVEVKEGKYSGLKIKDLEITPVASFGANLGLNMDAVIKATELCQRFGIDLVSAGSVIAFAVELLKKGIISREDIGYDLDWGDDEAVFQLLQDIVEKKGIGKILAEGTKRAADHFKGADKYAVHIKGLEIPMIDPRGRWSTWTLGMLTNIRGGDHLRCRNPIENLRYNENKHGYLKERFGFTEKAYDQLDMPADLKARAIDLENDTVDIAVMSRWAEDLINLFNSMGICIRPPVMHKIGPTVLARAYTVLTGMEITAEELMRAAERIWNLMKLFNIREGEEPGEIKFPRRFYEEKAGGEKLDEEKIQNVLEKYYEVRGWEMNTGKPKRETLERLGIYP